MAGTPNEIATGLGPGNKFIERFANIKALFGIKRPEPNTEKQNARKLLQDLGEWAREAYPKKNKRWHRPVLRGTQFIEHLKKTNGYCEPEGQCTATFAWAQLLFALNIRPGAGVVSWEQQPYDFNPVTATTLTLEMEGPVLWHILNLYRLYNKSDPRDSDPSSQYDLSFGALFISQETRTRPFLVTFMAGELKSTKEPFRYKPRDCPPIFGEAEGYLPFDRQNVVDLYRNALDTGISDSTLKLPSPQTEYGDSTPLDERIKELVRVLKALRTERTPLTSQPYLVTHK